jgi:peptidoglycan/LPS O-acetylase OafA/YrhL
MGQGTTPTEPSISPEIGRIEGQRDLSRLDARDSNILKGLAIAAIVLHNFFHKVSPARENEFFFHPDGFGVFLRTVSHPSLAIQAFFSFFGYLGVPVFIFLSAYGLSKRYWDDSSSWAQFTGRRIRKLFPIFGVVVLPWMLFDALHMGLGPFFRTVFPQIALLFMGLSPLVPGMSMPPVGPWWFIPFILEFYAVFFALRAATRRFGWQGLVVLGLVGLVVSQLAHPRLSQWGINVYETPLGQLPSICMGIAAARYSFRLPVSLVAVSSMVMLMGCVFAAWWPLTYPAAIVIFLWAYLGMRPSLRKSRILELLGDCSILIFLLNGIVRDYFVQFATTPGRQLLFGAVTMVTSVAIAALIQQLLSYRAGKGPASPEGAKAHVGR